jgi:hypothetical protein
MVAFELGGYQLFVFAIELKITRIDTVHRGCDFASEFYFDAVFTRKKLFGRMEPQLIKRAMSVNPIEVYLDCVTFFYPK